MSGGGTRSGRRSGSGAKNNASPASGEYKEFDDVPLDFGFYEGYAYSLDGNSGGETVKWFEENSNFRSVINEMSDDDKGAFIEYAKGKFMYGQQYAGFSSMTQNEQKLTRIYDKFLDKSVVNSNVKVVRFATPELLLGAGKIVNVSLSDLQAMKGKIITSKANLSCSAAKEGLKIGDDAKNIEYKLHIPAGAKGAGMYIGVKDIHGWETKQREFMVNRDTQWQVGNTKWNKSRGIFETDLFFKGTMPHDYN